MPVFKTRPVEKYINNKLIKTSETSIVVQEEYKTNGESNIIVRGVNECQIFLDSLSTDHVNIKSMTNTIVIGDKPIDEEFDEIILEKGSSIELVFASKWWYIISSDGIKEN